MALNLYTQKDIEQIDTGDIPEEFINYFDGLSESEKQRIARLRPDLSKALGYSISFEASETNTISLGDKFEVFDLDQIECNAAASWIREISDNVYDGMDAYELAKKGEVNPLELLTVREYQEFCKIHGIKYTPLSIKYNYPSIDHPGLMSTYVINVKWCPKCNRIYCLYGRSDSILEHLKKINIPVNIYSIQETDAFISKNLPIKELGNNEGIYILDNWNVINPTCPIHGNHLNKTLSSIKYNTKIIRFYGYLCSDCDKLILPKAKEYPLTDKCAEVGIPIPKMEPLTMHQVKKRSIVNSMGIHFYIDNGTRKPFKFSNYSGFNYLDETDMVVVSDSRYCNLLGHDTEEKKIVFSVAQKHEGKHNYLSLAGYCYECQKYYMSEEDYNVVYHIGRPDLNVIIDLEKDDYQITSGEVFNMEKQHLAALESDLNAITDEIYNSPDYVNPYETYSGGYDNGELVWGKKVSNDKYSDKLELINGYKPKPYSYRVDLSCDGDSQTYYLGPSAIHLSDGMRVYSFNDRSFGQKLVNYRTVDIDLKGKKYKVKLSRQFDIADAQLYGYVNLRTDEDSIFREGITDPFLIQVLKLRKKQHNLVDIIATIQENQNAIVDENINQNIVVQGCAGSGKTMVLLHRLSSLKYNYADYDFSKSVILTPNEQFSIHIKGVADGLQIGYINRLSVEQYYVEMLKEYSSDFSPKNKISSEIFVNQVLVNYIYSNSFIDSFYSSYDEIMHDRSDAFSMLEDLCNELGIGYINPSVNGDDGYIPSINRIVNRISSMVALSEREISEAESIYRKTEEELEDIISRLPEAEVMVDTCFSDSIARVRAALAANIKESQITIDENKVVINRCADEISVVERQLLPFGKREKIAEIKKFAEKAKRKIRSEESNIEIIRPLFESQVESKTQEDVLDWMEKVSLHIPETREEIRKCDTNRRNLTRLNIRKIELADQVNTLKNKYEKLLETRYSEKVIKDVEYLKEKVNYYSDYATYCMVFEHAIQAKINEMGIKANRGLHRYDLYAELLFCKKYYNKLPESKTFISVDEGQDLSINEYRLIYELNNRKVIFNIYGDVNQLIKPGRGISNWNGLIEEFKMKEYQLNENYRNTNQITRYCNSCFDMRVLQTGVDGAKVREIPRKELENELSKLKIHSEKIAILVPRSIQRKKYLDMDILPSSIKDIIGQQIDDGHISFMYVDEVKGIEFQKVYVIPNKMSKNEKYIAYTRALSELVIVYDESVPDDIAEEE